MVRERVVPKNIYDKGEELYEEERNQGRRVEEGTYLTMTKKVKEISTVTKVLR